MSIVPGRDVPEVPQAWVDAVNKAINDANHEDLCSSLHALADCDSYRPGQWDIGVDLTIAVGVLDPLLRGRIAGEFAEAAKSLAATVRDLDAHIGKRAWELAEPQILAVKDESDAKTAELERELAAADQRFNDLMREIQRQNKARDREFDELKRLRAIVHRVGQIRCWQNEDGKWFAFRDDLHAAINGEKEN